MADVHITINTTQLRYHNNFKYPVLREEQNLRERICLPLALILLAFEKAHGQISGQFDFEKTFMAINEHFYFPGLKKNGSEP